MLEFDFEFVELSESESYNRKGAMARLDRPSLLMVRRSAVRKLSLLKKANFCNPLIYLFIIYQNIFLQCCTASFQKTCMYY